MRILYIDSENIKVKKFDLLMLCHQYDVQKIKIYLDEKKENANTLYYGSGFQWMNDVTVVNIDTQNRKNSIDIHIMVDIFADIYSNQCREILIATQDSDFLPLVHTFQGFHIPIVFITMKRVDWMEKVSVLCLSDLFANDVRIIGECFCFKGQPVLSLSSLRKLLKSLNLRRSLSSPLVFKNILSFLSNHDKLFSIQQLGDRCFYITFLPLLKKIFPLTINE